MGRKKKNNQDRVVEHIDLNAIADKQESVNIPVQKTEARLKFEDLLDHEPPYYLYMIDFHSNLTFDGAKKMLSSFRYLSIETQQSQCVCFAVEFDEKDEAISAHRQLDNFIVFGKPIKMSFVSYDKMQEMRHNRSLSKYGDSANLILNFRNSSAPSILQQQEGDYGFGGDAGNNFLLNRSSSQPTSGSDMGNNTFVPLANFRTQCSSNNYDEADATSRSQNPHQNYQQQSAAALLDFRTAQNKSNADHNNSHNDDNSSQHAELNFRQQKSSYVSSKSNPDKTGLTRDSNTASNIYDNGGNNAARFLTREPLALSEDNRNAGATTKKGYVSKFQSRNLDAVGTGSLNNFRNSDNGNNDI